MGTCGGDSRTQGRMWDRGLDAATRCGAQAAVTMSARIAVAHSTTNSSYSARSWVDNEPFARSQSARIRSFNSAADRTEPEITELGDMR